MFGYIRIFKPELRFREFDAYRAVYCALCKRLGKTYGFSAKALLTYDCAFLALFGIALDGIKPEYKSGKCRMNPMKKCLYCENGGDALDFAAAVNVVLFFFKIKDTLADAGILKKFLSGVCYPFANSMRKKAADIYPELDEIGRELFASQQDVEKKSGAGIDELAHPTAFALSKIALMMDGRLEKLGYHLGRWIYIIDAQDDLERDIKKKRFNPRLDKEHANGLLNISLSIVIEEARKLELSEFSEIIENILTLGLPEAQRLAYKTKEGKNI